MCLDGAERFKTSRICTTQTKKPTEDNNKLHPRESNTLLTKPIPPRYGGPGGPGGPAGPMGPGRPASPVWPGEPILPGSP